MKKQGESTALARFNSQLAEALTLLKQAPTYDEVKGIHNTAELLRAYAEQHSLSTACYNEAMEVKLRAERKMGEFLLKTPKNKGGQHTHKAKRTGGAGVTGASTGVSPLTSALTLGELGISKEESARYQRLARIAEPRFDECVEKTKDAGERLTTQRILTEAERTGALNRPKRATRATTTSPEGEITVAVNLKLRKDQEQPFLTAWEALGDDASRLVFNYVIRSARQKSPKKRPAIEILKANHGKADARMVA